MFCDFISHLIGSETINIPEIFFGVLGFTGKTVTQGLKLRLTGRQCDQKLGVGDQNFRTGRQQATNLLSPLHLKFQVKRAFFKRKLKAPLDNCSKTKRRFYNHHIYLAPYCFRRLLPIRLSRTKTWRNCDGDSNWLININYNKMKLCRFFTILNLCKTDSKIAYLLNLVVGGVVKCHILASTKRPKVSLLSQYFLSWPST